VRDLPTDISARFKDIRAVLKRENVIV